MKKIILFSSVIALGLGIANIASAKSSYVNDFTAKYGSVAGTSYSCNICHTTTPALNSYGTDFASTAIPSHTARVFDAGLETRDSDGDTFSNLVEIRAGTFPGNSGSKPAATDTTAPTVSTFTVPATSSSLTVSITALTASDNVGVTGYRVTESATAPAASATGWSTSSPASYTCATAGAKTLYAWAKDAANNVSASRSASVTITLSPTPPPSDTTAPTVSTFTLPATSSSLTVAINAIGATDNVGVTGYLVNESSSKPSATDPNWNATAPTSHTFASAGAKTLYAWAKDAANNVSTSRSAAVTITTAPTPPPPGPEPVPADEMGVWIGTWFSVTMRNEGLFVNGVGLTNDRQSAKGYLNISGWDPNTNVLDATLSYIDPSNNQPVTMPLPLNVISGGVHNFRVWAHVTAGDVIYGFSALIKGTTNAGAVVLGSLKTIGGYHARVSTDEGGWLRITGKVRPEANVPISINVP
jgi:hypothetical protein